VLRLLQSISTKERVIMRKITLSVGLFATIGPLGLAVLMASAQQRRSENPTEEFKSKEQLGIQIKAQEYSPLIITSVRADSVTDERKPIIYLTVANNSASRILAYTIKYETSINNAVISGSTIVNNPGRKQALQPGKYAEVQISGIEYPAPPINITLSVDFVEFVGGTRWGPDTLNTGDRLDGLRAGAAAETEALTYKLMVEGPDAVIRSLDSAMPQANQAAQRSSQWLDGFRHGVGWVRERVRGRGKAFSEIEKELQDLDSLRREWR
jgi:hypothetical protein